MYGTGPARQSDNTPPALPRSILREVWDQVPVGVVVLDQAGRVIYANATAAGVTGLEPDEVPDVLEGRTGRLLDAEGRAMPLRQFPAFVSAAVGGWNRGTTAQVFHEGRSPKLLHLSVIRMPDSTDADGPLFVTVISERHSRVREWTRPLDDQARTLADLSRELAVTALNVAGVVDLVAEELAGGEGELCVISLLQDDRRSLKIEAAAHPDYEVAEFFRHLDRFAGTAVGEGIAGRVAASGKPLVLTDARGGEALKQLREDQVARFGSPPPMLRGFEERQFQAMVVPMVQRSELLGTIALARWETATPYSPEDVAWLTEVAELTALAMANARLHDEAAARLVVIEATRRVDLAMAASVDQRLTLDVILDQLLVHMGVDAAAILVPSQTDGRLATAASAGLHSGTVRLIDGADEPYARAWALRRTEIVRSDELASWTRQAGLAAESIDSAEIVPLLAHGEPVGLLELFTRRGQVPNQEQRLGIESLAVRAGLTIEAWREGPQQSRYATAKDRVTLGEVQELSRAQRAVLRLLSEGTSNREIASRLHISENTVKSHLREIFRKLGTRTRLQAAMKGAAWLRANSALEKA